MTDISLNLGDVADSTRSYTVFEQNQVLTPDQLNGVASFLDDQERITRVALLGVGIACGLWPSLASDGVHLSNGVGVTTDGDVLFIPQPAVYDRYKPYDSSAPTYPPFEPGGTLITAYELVRQGDTDALAAPLTGFAASEHRTLGGMVAVLYIESYLHDKDPCTGTDCDNMGKDWIHATKLLLVDAAAAPALVGAASTPDAAARALAPVMIDRPALGGALAAEADLAAVYKSACDKLYTSLTAALAAIYAPCQWFLRDLAPADPAPRWLSTLNALRQGMPVRAMQYYYDFLKDVAETYNAFRDALYGDTAVCCPDVSAFPKHVVLGSLDPAQRSAGGRTGFYPSPMVSERFERRGHARFLVRKLDTLIATFAPPGGPTPIRITPSVFEDRPLEERAIPFYYAVREDLPVYRAWSFRLWRRGMERYNYSYSAASYGAQGGAANPFAASLGPFDFFRIEGHVGANVQAAMQQLRSQISANNLPIDVEMVLLGQDKTKVFVPPIRATGLANLHYLLRNDLAAQLGEATDYGKTFAAQVSSAVDASVISNADAGAGVDVKGQASAQSAAISTHAVSASAKLLSATYDMASDWQTDLFSAAGAASQLRQTLSPVTKNDFVSPFDSLVTGSNTRLLTWVDTIVKDNGDKQATRLLLSTYASQHAGLEHCAGVLRGGTFVLAHDESGTVVADFMLPYSSSDTRGEPFVPPKLVPLPRPPILVNTLNTPIRIAAFPDKSRFDQISSNLVNQVKDNVALQNNYLSGLRDTIGIFAGAKTGGGTPGPVLNIPGLTAGGAVFTGMTQLQPADATLGVHLGDMTYYSQKVDSLRAQSLDPGLPDAQKAAIDTQLATAESQLSDAVVATTRYVASTGMDVAPGSDGATAMTTASAALNKVSNIDALASAEKGLMAVGNLDATSASTKTMISNVLSIRGLR
jgi:hypothetical protein